MTTLHVENTVRDYEAWQEAFDNFERFRAENGVRISGSAESRVRDVRFDVAHDLVSGDRLTRDDHLYDFIVEIDHNTHPRIAGRGSAVFLHLARDNFGPTAGCVSMTKSAMLHLLQRLGPETKIVIE